MAATSTRTSFSTLLRHAQGTDATLSLQVTEDWMQGRSTFGGLQTAFALRTMRQLVPSLPLRTLQTTFIAPVSGQLRCRATVLRSGKHAIHVEARLFDGPSPLAVVIGVFGAARPSAVHRALIQPPVASSNPIELPYVEGITPTFTQHFHARWLVGTPPFMGTSTPNHVVEVDMRDEGPASEGHAVAIADLLPPIALSYLEAPAPGSSLTWMLEFLQDDFSQLPLTGWRVDAELLAARDGYTNQSATIWGPGGVPVALSRQSMLVFG